MSNKTTKIQLTTYNQFGEFHFYVSREEVQTYLDDRMINIDIDDFLDECTSNDTRKLFDWIKESSKLKSLE
ncbi:hypothetical protein SAMN04487895_101567 [Paenibacillus sophorae]|uniref:Uncharacterized protein n=1 Tax=Paenibacillus sophorae TaxID=1333845 RepID=A0A1H8GLF5_9BACL|nr:hypothetical protein SAMN04487895_101567 [Paenibacillus sophorae]